MVRTADCRQAGAREGAGERAGWRRRVETCRHGPGRPADHRLREGRGAPRAPAEGGRQAARRGGLPARHARFGRRGAGLMPRYRLRIEYDGTPYIGWQRQENGHSVQGAIEAAILSLTGETVSIRGAGRTDSGVHAMGQVAHADLSRHRKEHTLRSALNAHLGMAGERVAILDAAEVPDDFDARFSAKKRHYL